MLTSNCESFFLPPSDDVWPPLWTLFMMTPQLYPASGRMISVYRVMKQVFMYRRRTRKFSNVFIIANKSTWKFCALLSLGAWRLSCFMIRPTLDGKSFLIMFLSLHCGFVFHFTSIFDVMEMIVPSKVVGGDLAKGEDKKDRADCNMTMANGIFSL